MSEIPHTNITRLKVNNYRSLADVDIALSPLTVFVGKNAAGKSNVIDVLRFVRDGLRDGLDCAVKRRGGMKQLRCWLVPQNEDISIQLHFSGPEYSGFYGFSFGSDRDDQVRMKSEQLHIYPSKVTPKGYLFEVIDEHFTTSLGIDAPSDPLSQNSFVLSQLCASEAKAVCDFLANMNFYDLSPAEIRKPQKALNPFPLAETGHNLASALLEVQKRGQDYYITEPLEVVVPGIDGYQVSQAGEHLVTKLHYTFSNGHKRQSTSHLTYEADGTVRMLGILTALYQERYPSPLSIEEPEKALYPGALAVLSDLLKDAADYKSQILVTTHGTYFIDKLPLKSLLVVEKENGVTKIGPIMTYQQESIAEELFSPGELMQIEGLHREGANLRAKV